MSDPKYFCIFHFVYLLYICSKITFFFIVGKIEITDVYSVDVILYYLKRNNEINLSLLNIHINFKKWEIIQESVLKFAYVLVSRFFFSKLAVSIDLYLT